MTDEMRRRFPKLDPELVGQPKPDDATSRPAMPGAFASVLPSALVSLVGFAVLVGWPVAVAGALGVIGTLGLCLLAITGGYAVLQILAQQREPPHVFQLLRLRRTPVVSLLFVVAVVASLFSGDEVHDVRAPSTPAADARPSLGDAFADWVAAPAGACAIDAGRVEVAGQSRKLSIRPLLFVAAEGGGVRAAWWTVEAMSTLTDSECGRQSVFLTSGASGGAVGLGILATDPTPLAAESGSPSPMQQIASEHATAAALDGLLSRDLLAGLLGVEIAANDGPADDRFPDRAGLMERVWEDALPGFGHPFPRTGADRVVPWYSVFNGTSVANGCRVLVSDVRLGSAETCRMPGNMVPGTYDLFRADPCYVGLPTSTASLLAGRFPYVTPSGVIVKPDSTAPGAACADQPRSFRDQLIDGGYAENTGIDTLTSALLQLGPAIQQVNSEALPAGQPLVVPLVVFLHNSYTAGVPGPPAAPKPRAEALVPPLNAGAASFLGTARPQLQRVALAAAAWLPSDVSNPDGEQIRAAVDQRLLLSGQAMTVAPNQDPALALPLGWTLSRGTQEAMGDAMATYAHCISDQPNRDRLSGADLKAACPTSAAFDQLYVAFHGGAS